MTFNPNDYVSASESIILSGTVNIGHSDKSEFVKFILTSKKIITAGEAHLQIIPLNQIRNIEGNVCCLFIKGDSCSIRFYYVDNPAAYNKIIQEIAKRIG